MKKHGITIHMGAGSWTAEVRQKNGSPVRFDLHKMSKDKQRNFIRELVIAYREAGL